MTGAAIIDDLRARGLLHDTTDEAELRALASYVHQLGGGKAEERQIGVAPGSAAEPG